MEYNTLSEKAAFLSGLIKGKQIDDEITLAMADLLCAIANEVDAHDDAIVDMEDDLFDLSEAVGDIEEDIYDYDDDEYADDEDDDDEDLYEVTCPQCGETIYIDDLSLDSGDVACPACGEILSLIMDDEEPGE